MGMNIRILTPGDFLYYGYNAVVSYVLFVKIFIIND